MADCVRPSQEFRNSRFFQTDEALFHGVARDVGKLPLLTKLLNDERSVAMEVDGLVTHLRHGSGIACGKGIYVEAQDDGCILLTELMVDHPGWRPAGFGITRGQYFRSDDTGCWQRIEHLDQCDCGNEPHHIHHLVVAQCFEALLADQVFAPVRAGVFKTPGLDHRSDSGAMKWFDSD